MSQDQRPARVRVISAGADAMPQRRRHDRAVKASRDARAADAPQAPGVLPAILFVIGCAAGGALTTLFDLWGALLR